MAEPMSIQVPAHIEKLIFLHDSVALPSLGLFVAKRSAARVDQDSGMLLPPMRSLHFEESSVADDGLIVSDLAATHQLSSAEARQVLQRWIDGLRERLESREIVSIPGIGRLYRNYARSLQFLPDSSHFSPEHFVSPTLQFSPLGEVRKVLDTPGVALEQQPPLREKEGKSNGRLIGLFVALFLVALGAGAYWWLSARQPDAPVAVVPAAPEAAEVPKPAPPAAVAEVEEMAVEEALPAQETPVVKPAPGTAKIAPPKQAPKAVAAEAEKTCILVVATKKDRAEAETLRSTLKNSAYEAYIVSKNGYQVQVRFPYEQVSEIQQAIFNVQHLTGERDIWIKQK